MSLSLFCCASWVSFNIPSLYDYNLLLCFLTLMGWLYRCCMPAWNSKTSKNVSCRHDFILGPIVKSTLRYMGKILSQSENKLKSMLPWSFMSVYRMAWNLRRTWNVRIFDTFWAFIPCNTSRVAWCYNG